MVLICCRNQEILEPHLLNVRVLSSAELHLFWISASIYKQAELL